MRSKLDVTKARTTLLGTTILAGASTLLLAAAPAFAQDTGAMETVTVTGYRASLTDSTNAKRSSVSFSDSVFAEDIGKFPDTNIAEAFNRIPGITIVREVQGEGLEVAIRGLGVNFTKNLLNGNPIAVASTGRTDSQNTNREVDLNMFPTELFSQLTVSKSPSPFQEEGGAAGTVDMRSMRPFDRPGFRVTYSLQGTLATENGKVGEKGTLVVSDTEGPFGILVGITLNHALVRTTGFETIGWTNPNISAAQCGVGNTCNQNGGNGWTIPAVAPTNASTTALGIAGDTIDAAWLLAHNPGLTTTQLSNSLLPRLGRPSDQWGHRDRGNAVVSLEYRPMDELRFYFDFIGGRLINQEHRTDMMFQVRSSSIIPLNVKIDNNGVVTSGTYANAQMFLEDRPYLEKEDFLSFNPGMDWQVTELLNVKLQANATRSHFFRDYPSLGVYTNATTVSYSNTGAVPTFTSGGVDLQNPTSWHWSGQRAWVQQEKRYTHTEGIHLDLSYGGEEMMVKVGGAYNNIYRDIRPLDNGDAWQAAVCGGNPSYFLPAPNTRPTCDGINATHPGAYDPTLWFGKTDLNGYGYSGGHTNTWLGSLIPDANIGNYMVAGNQGYAVFDWDAAKAAAHFNQYATTANYVSSSNTGASAGRINEKTWAAYAELTGQLHPGGRTLKYDFGLRWVETHQMIFGFARSYADPRNRWTITCGPGTYAALTPGGCVAGTTTIVAAPDGTLYPNINVFANIPHTYGSFLPSANFVYEVADDFQVRASFSRTMTRPNPNSLLPGANFSTPSADNANIGNSALPPFYSNNIDLGAELYTGAEGYIGVAAFRKGLAGFTVGGTTNHVFSELQAYGIRYADLTAQQQATMAAYCHDDATCANWALTYTQQIPATGLLTVNGLEFNWVQPLDFLTDPWLGVKGFGFTANATIIDQRGSGNAPAIATGVAAYTYNVVAYYEQNGIMGRLSYVFNAGTINTGTNQNSIPLASQFGSSYNQLDLSASLKLARVFGDLPSDPEVTLDIQNLGQTKQRAYFQFPNAPFTLYKPGRVFLFGVRGSF